MALFHVIDPQEIDFSFTEASSFEDMESGDQMPIVPSKLAEDYRALVQAHIDTLTSKAGAQPVDYMLLNTGDAARLRAVPLPVDAAAHGEDQVAVSFLTPLFLLGLAALAVPVLIHLTQRERKSVVEFPSLMFLRKIPYESVQRRRIRDWLLLAMRLAAIALIVMAFARPFLRGSERRRRGRRRARHRACCSTAPTAWATAIRGRARSARRPPALESATPPDRISVVLFADTAEVALRSTPDRSRAVAEINAATPGPGLDEVRPRAEAGRAACSPNRCCRARK